MGKSKNSDIISNPHYDNLYSQGGVAAPSGATLRKYFGAPKQAKRRLYPDEPITVSEGTLNDALYGTMDYHEAMIDNIEKMREGKPIRSYNRIERFAIKVAKEIKDYYCLNRKTLEEQIIESKTCKEIDSKLAYDVLTVEGALQEFLPDEIYPIITGRSRKTIFQAYEEKINLRKKLIDELKHETDKEKKREISKAIDLIPYKISRVLEHRLKDIDSGKIS